MSDWEDLKIRNKTENKPDIVKLLKKPNVLLPIEIVVSLGRSKHY